MTTRRPLQPLPPPSANVVHTHYALNTKSADGHVVMEEQLQEDTQDLASVVSGLSSLENEADEFEKLMIQNARDERRLNDALHGRVQAFRKARTHPRVGLTIDNLERNNARNDMAAGANAHAKFDSPASSSGSTRSDPAIHAPAGWGRKSRSNRNWMRAITYEEEQQEEQHQQGEQHQQHQQQQTPVPADDTINGLYNDRDQDQQHADDANMPRQSVQDSPLSHKSSMHGTPRNDRSTEWDLTFELNEASIIASTPYLPRNTALDDIRQREIDSLKEQAVTTARLGRIRARSPEQTRRPPSSSNKSAITPADGASADNVQSAAQASSSPEKRLRTRTNSWKSIGKSQAVTGTGKENSPIAVYKTSTETVSVVERNVSAGSQKSPSRPARHRREDSQDLLRRLARVSTTPSPARLAAARLQTAPARQPNSSSQTMVTDTPPTPPERKDESPGEALAPDSSVEPAAPAPEVQSHQEEPKEASREPETQPEPEEQRQETAAEDVDATSMAVEQIVLLPKTPVVTGAWVDTPGPRTIRKQISITRTPPQSPKKSSPRKGKEPEKSLDPTAEEALGDTAAETVRPQLPSSALQALVQEAKSHDRRQSADYGDSTINSLEDLISTSPQVEVDEDTLQGLQLPTATPRNEAERQRQQELLHLHRMNDRLRAARTSIRDASRGMKRVEDRVEHSEELGDNRTKTNVVLRECPCVVQGGAQHFSLWRWWKGFFWDERLKAKREGTRWKTWGGLTGLSIFILVFFLWWISEEIACEMYCHHPYANYSPYPFSVNLNAPQYPFVISTLLYRNFIKIWWVPLWSFVSWMWTSMFGVDTDAQLSKESFKAGAWNAATQTAAWAGTASSRVAEELVWDQSMMNDEVVR